MKNKILWISLGFFSTGVSFAEGPCDIYAKGNTPCVAAFSPIRALYESYNGSLYQVRRVSDNATKDITPLQKGGIANAAMQDDFCAGQSCKISIIYDQSGNGNHLTKAPAGSDVYGPYDCIEADAAGKPIYINGYKAYGVHIEGDFFGQNGKQVGYRNTTTKAVAQGDNPETIYMVADGQYVNGACCFNFGNALLVPAAGGYGTMEAVYFGTNGWWTTGEGQGPWVMADLEVGVYSMGGAGNYSDAAREGNKVNSQSLSLPYPFVTAYLKGNSSTPITDGGPFVLKGGDAQSAPLTTMWNGDYPVQYFPMHRGGGIVLGVGGDNSSGAQGNFFEGVMTTGFATEETDAKIQANIIAARYGQTTTISSSSSSAIPETPYSSASLPGTLQMENYNLGSADSAYHDLDVGNAGKFYRNDDVDMDSIAEGGYALGWLMAGEWLDYSIQSSVSGTLNFFARVSTGMNSGAFHLVLNGVKSTPMVSVDSTGGWGTYQVVSGSLENLVVGANTLRFVVDSSYFNIDWILFSEPGPTQLKNHATSSTKGNAYTVFDLQGNRLDRIIADNPSGLNAKMNRKGFHSGVYLILDEATSRFMSQKVVIPSRK